jgi:predicted outer membrane repeat protein
MLLACLSVAVASTGVVSATNQDFYVSPTGNDDLNNGLSTNSQWGTITKAITCSTDSNNVTIHLDEGTFRGVGNTKVEINKAHNSQGGAINIVGKGYNKTIIDGDSVSYIFDIKTDSIVNLINLTIRNGKNNNGGAIANAGTLTIVDSIFEFNNATSNGGAIVHTAGTLTIVDSIFGFNNAKSGGGAIRSTNGHISIFNSIFNNNYADGSGGAIYSGNTGFNIDKSNFTNNSAYNGAGALSMASPSSINSNITNSYFVNNSAYVVSTLSISGTSLINNTFINCSSDHDVGYVISIGSGISYLKNNIIIDSFDKSGKTHIENNNYNGYINVNVTSATLTVTIPTNIILTTTVTDDMGTPITGLYVYFYMNGTQVGSANLVNGTATYKFTKLMDNGLYNLFGNYTYASNLSTFKNGTVNMSIDRTPVTLYVSNSGDDDTGDGSELNPYKTISKAISEGFIVSIFPTICLLDGTYSGIGNVNISVTDLGVLTIVGKNYNKTFIDGENLNWIFRFGENTEVDLINLTFINGRVVISANANLNINYCIFSNNKASGNILTMGGMHNTSIKNSIFVNNMNGTYIYSGEINNCSFINNVASGDIVSGSTGSVSVAVIDSEFINNRVLTSYAGTATSVLSGGVLQTINNKFINNTVDSHGGVLCANINSINDTFEGNKALKGGAAYGYGNFTNTKFINNTATELGGAIYLTGNLNLDNCTFENNTAGINGHDIYVYGNGKIGNLNLTFESINTTILYNTLKAYLRSGNLIIGGGNVSFYVNGTYVGKGELINGVASISCLGFDNGIYEVYGNYTNPLDINIKNATLNISANVLDSFYVYISPTGNDYTGDGSYSSPYATISKALEVGLEKTKNLVIHLLDGTYSGVGFVNLTLPNSLNLTITGSTYNRTIIDGGKTNWGFRIEAGLGLVTLRNLVLRNFNSSDKGTPSSGVGVVVHNIGNLIIDNCIIRDNRGTAVVNERDRNGNFNISLASYWGNIIIKNSYLTNNTGGYNGGAFANFANASIYNSIFEANNCTNYGAEIFTGYYQQSTAELYVYNTIIKNTLGGLYSTLSGGAIHLGGYSLFKDCYFTNNSFDIHLEGASAHVDLINTTFFDSNGLTAYGNVFWKVYNSSFINMRKNITFVGYTGKEGIIEGTLFKNNPGIVITGGNYTVRNCAILDSPLFVSHSNGNNAFYLDNNWWGTNEPLVSVLSYANVILNNWIIVDFISDNRPGLIQSIILSWKLTDGENVSDYDISSIPIPLEDREFVFTTSNGTVLPSGGNLSDDEEFNATFVGNQYGNCTVNAVFNNNTVSLDIELYQLNTTTDIILSNTTGKKGSTLNITAEVYEESSGLPVNEGTVEFFVDGKSVANVTVVNGKASYSWTVDKEDGDYDVYAIYHGTDKYVDSFNNDLFRVFTINVTTELSLSNDSPKVGDIITITLNVFEEGTNAPINEGEVEFYIGGQLIDTVAVVDGKATISWTVTDDVGSNSIKANYIGPGFYADSEESKPLEILEETNNNNNTGNGTNNNNTGGNGTNNTGNGTNNNTGGNGSNSSSVKTSTQITLNNFKGTYGKVVKLTATLKANGKNLSGKVVNFYVNNKLVGKATTNSQGIAIFNYKVISTGSLSVKAIFAGDSAYVTSNKNSKLTVPKLSVLKIKNTKYVKGKRFVIKSLLINTGPNKSTFKVYYKLPKGLTYYKPKVSSGKLSYNKRTRVLTWTVSNLKVNKKKSAVLTWTLIAKKGRYTITPKTSKTTGLKVSYNNPLKKVLVR